MKVRFVTADQSIAYCEWTEQDRTRVATFELEVLVGAVGAAGHQDGAAGKSETSQP
jgi:hypothetical protein